MSPPVSYRHISQPRAGFREKSLDAYNLRNMLPTVHCRYLCGDWQQEYILLKPLFTPIVSTKGVIHNRNMWQRQHLLGNLGKTLG